MYSREIIDFSANLTKNINITITVTVTFLLDTGCILLSIQYARCSNAGEVFQILLGIIYPCFWSTDSYLVWVTLTVTCLKSRSKNDRCVKNMWQQIVKSMNCN